MWVSSLGYVIEKFSMGYVFLSVSISKDLAHVSNRLVTRGEKQTLRCDWNFQILSHEVDLNDQNFYWSFLMSLGKTKHFACNCW